MKPFHVVSSLGLLWLTACGAAAIPAPAADVAPPAATLAASAAPASPALAGEPAASPAPAVLPLVRIHKSASCGCCSVWVDHVRDAGFPVEVHDTEALMQVKEKLGVPAAMASCHTAEVDGYFVEGHVPAEDIKRLLAERPAARGLAVPGMPMGSPGMESPDGHRQPYTVALIGNEGQPRAFAHHD